MMAITGVQGQSGAVYPVLPQDGKIEQPRAMSWGDIASVLVEAQRLVGEESQKVANKEMETYMKDMQVNRTLNMVATENSIAARRTSMWVRFGVQVGTGIAGAAMGAYALRGNAIAARKTEAMGKLTKEADLKLQDSTKRLAEAENSGDASRLARARVEAQTAQEEAAGVQTQVQKISKEIDGLNKNREVAQTFANTSTQVMYAGNELGTGIPEAQAKRNDLAAQVGNTTAGLDREMAERRRGNASEAVKRADEVAQALVEIARVNARNLGA
ncbi:hypothetical protein CAL14_04435 [Bordetella genomosp. 9]|uniref:hypothetical protein n=1 Tax=Bordetella genomosp. 9 TaxID=1416803 RepID=UPI000A290056|nr:hypothetical protein [Bordetella genomosp. 9]ARP89625.1 hypothetical protein CAL14_04435 [Bordetella genomosp. 9]